MYFPGDHKEEVETVGLKTPRRERPPIQKCLRRGQEILVQVLKEGIGTKGPTLTSYLSIPGRYLVMMPYMERLGVSRKIEDDDARRESRKILQELNPPEGFGFIIRTAGIGKPKTELKRDLSYLVRLWKTLEKRMHTVGPIGELYTESDLLIRTLRDVFTSEIGRIIVDDISAAHRAHDFLSVVSPRSGSQVYLYKDPIPLFHRFDIERQIDGINARTVPLPSGGSLVIDQAEAMVAIDVNSGKSRENRDAEMTAYKTDMEACDEICRQLKLRDLGGVIVIDMIDMHQAKHRRDVETRFRNNLKRDRARTQVLPISRFGILEMTRQRMRPSLTKSNFTPCPHCQGQGQVKTPETVVLEVSRRLAVAMHRSEVAQIELTVSPDVAFQLLNRKRAQLVAMEQRFGKPVMVRVSGSGGIDFIDIACFDARGGTVSVDLTGPLPAPELEQIQGGVEMLTEAENETEAASWEGSESNRIDQKRPLPDPTQDSSASTHPTSSPSPSSNLEDEDDVAIAPPSRPHGSTRPATPRPEGHAADDSRQDGAGKPRRRRRGHAGRGGRNQPVANTTAEPLSDEPPRLTTAQRGTTHETEGIVPVASEDRTLPGAAESKESSAPAAIAGQAIVSPASTVTTTTAAPHAPEMEGHPPKPVAGGWRRKRSSQGAGLLYPRIQSGTRPHVSSIHSKPHQSAANPGVTAVLAVPKPSAGSSTSMAPQARSDPSLPTPHRPVQGPLGQLPRPAHQPPRPQQPQNRRPPHQEQRPSPGPDPARHNPVHQRHNQPRSQQANPNQPRPQPSRPHPQRSHQPASQNSVTRTPPVPTGNPSRGYKNAVVSGSENQQPQ